jgi:hypothetical protein
MQTSFMHPPFGFALFYLRSVAAKKEYTDRVTGRRMAPVTTGQIYWGAVPFVGIQIIMIGLVIAFPQMVMVYKAGESHVNPNEIQIELPPMDPNAPFTYPGLPNTEQQMEKRDTQENREAQSIEDMYKALPPPGAAPGK